MSLINEIIKSKIDYFDAGWRKFKFNFIDKVIDREDKETVLIGYTDFDDCEIDIDKTRKEELIRETILHEITHIMLANIGLGKDFKKAPFDEEHTVTLISRELIRSFNSNKKLFEILIKPWEDTKNQNQ